MKKIVNIAIIFVMGSFSILMHGQCAVGNGVQFCSPSNGAATGTSTTVTAAGASNIVAMKLYVDGQDPAAATAHAASLTSTVNLAAGQHNLTVIGWDNPGNAYQSSITVSAGSSGAPAASSSSACSASSTGVTVCSPGNGSSTASPIQVRAAAAAASGIAAMKIYVDDQDSYTIQSNALNASLAMGSGSHNVVVQAWDNAGNVYKSSETVNVSGGGSTSSPAPAPTPSGACGASSTGVTVCAPLNGMNTGSPVQITAGAAAASGIAAMKVYIDNQDSYTIQSNSISTTLPLSAGSHSVVVQAWDNQGNVYKTPVSVSVSGGSAPAPSSCGTTSGVQFCSPTNGSAASGSVAVAAGGSSNIIAMKLYVDGQDPAAFGSTSNSLNTTVNLSSGGHNLALVGWDNAGNVYQQSINVNSAGAPAPTPTSGGSVPAPPANAIVLSNIQNQNGWQTCGGCGNNSGGTGTGPSYGISQGMSSPSLSGSSADFWTNGGPAYSGGYYFIEQPTVPRPVTYLKYEFDIYIPSQWVNTPQALEWECQENANGYTYNFAFQADYGSGHWRVFNYTTKNWEDTGIQMQPFSGGTWHHVISMFHASGTQTVHDSITVDGVTKAVNVTHNALYTGNGSELTNGFQVDLNQNGAGYQVYVDNMKVTLAD